MNSSDAESVIFIRRYELLTRHRCDDGGATEREMSQNEDADKTMPRRRIGWPINLGVLQHTYHHCHGEDETKTKVLTITRYSCESAHD